MAVLGKRKASGPSTDEADASEVFRRHFEAQFKPLAHTDLPTAAARDGVEESADEDDDEEGEEWGGLSDAAEGSSGEEEDEEEAEVEAVEVVDHSNPQASKPVAMSKHEFRALMSSRPPDQTGTTKPSQPAKTPSSAPTLPEDAPSLLAQDLELRRLISESHLLSPHALSPSGGGQAARPFAQGRTRQRATDLRVQALGSGASVLAQDKMPMSMRRGIAAAAGAREAKRRRQARENGIILEREVKGKGRKRDRTAAVDRPGVGRMKGAELRISQSDVKGIEGTRDTFGRRGRR